MKGRKYMRKSKSLTHANFTSAAYYKIQVFLKYELLRQVNEHVGDTVFKVLLWK